MQLAPIILAMFLMADPPTGTDRPSSFEEGTVVPYPIPPDICVEVHYNEGIRDDDVNVGIHRPPLSSKVLWALENVRQKGWAILRRCSLSQA
ncbi:protein of unknown function [Magnetospira sp. QH-2]|nr:protein of unknown function [Magnetospira sp. QH-2]